MRNEFENWLRLGINKILAETTIKGYGATINSISNWAIKSKLFNESLYTMSDIVVLNEKIRLLNSSQEFAKKNTKCNRKWSSSIKLYKQFINSNNQKKHKIPTIENKDKLDGKQKIPNIHIKENEYIEGNIILQEHLVHERNRELIKEAKKLFAFENNGHLYCEICGFDFYRFYGELGQGYIEAHHTIPVSELKDGDKTKIEDIAMLCSNCHRMVHRNKPWITKENFMLLLKQREI